MTSETRYMRYDTHTINGLNVQKLLTSQTALFRNAGTSKLSGNYTVYWGIRVFIRHVDSSEDEVTAGTPVAQVSRTGVGQGIQSNTWNCPETSLESDDAVVVRVYIKVGSDPWYNEYRLEFITDQAQDWDSPVQLDAATWTIYYYTRHWLEFLGGFPPQIATHGLLYYGNSTYNSRITNFTWTEEAPPPMAKAGLNVPQALPIIMGEG